LCRDGIGRDAVSVGDAQRLIAERRADELRKQAVLRAAEQQAVESDRLRFASIWKGVSADVMPPGPPAAVMLQVAKEAEPKRRSMIEDMLGRDEVVYHELPQEGEL
jgi:hypothetical protein